MGRKDYVEAEIDFEGLAAALKREEPPRVSAAEILERIRVPLRDAWGRGVPAERLCAIAKEYGVRLSRRSMSFWLRTGKLPKRGVRVDKTAGRDGFLAEEGENAVPEAGQENAAERGTGEGGGEGDGENRGSDARAGTQAQGAGSRKGEGGKAEE